MAASYVCRQVMIYTDTVLSSTQLDHLFKALQVIIEKVLVGIITNSFRVQLLSCNMRKLLIFFPLFNNNYFEIQTPSEN